MLAKNLTPNASHRASWLGWGTSSFPCTGDAPPMGAEPGAQVPAHSSPAGRTQGCSWVTQSPQRWMCHEHQIHDSVWEQPAGTLQTSLPRTHGTGSIRRQHPKNTFHFLYTSTLQNRVSASFLQTNDFPRDGCFFLAAVSNTLKLTDMPAGLPHPRVFSFQDPAECLGGVRDPPS